MSDPVLNIRRQDLTPSVRSYVDNLNSQVRELLKAHGAKNLHDFKRLIKERKVRVEAVENLQKLLNAYANAVRTGERPPEDLEFTEDYEDPETGETREIRLDLNEALKTTSEFFHTFGLDELREALPKSIHLTDEQKELVRKKMREGYNFAIVMSPASVLNRAFEHVLEATSMVVTSRSKGFPILTTHGALPHTPDVKWLSQEFHQGQKYRTQPATSYIVLLRINKEGSLTSLRPNFPDQLKAPKHGMQPLYLDEFLLIDRLIVDDRRDQENGFLCFAAPLSAPDTYCLTLKYYGALDKNKLIIEYQTISWQNDGRLLLAVKIPLET